MVIEAHKALKKRRKLRKLSVDELQYYKKSQKAALHLPPTPSDVNIFSFLSKKQEGYNDLIKQIGSNKDGRTGSRGNIMKASKAGHSKSCSETPLFHSILNLERSPRQKRRYSFSERVTVAFSKSKNYLLGADNGLLLTEAQVEGHPEVDQAQPCENQLDKHVDQGIVGVDGGADGQRTSDPREFQPLHANITFMDEHFLTNNLNDDDDSKEKLSVVTCEENFDLSPSEEQSSDSEGFVFTSDGSDNSQSYDKLVREYAKEDNNF